MYLRGDISILVPAVYRKLWLYLPRRLYYILQVFYREKYYEISRDEISRNFAEFREISSKSVSRNFAKFRKISRNWKIISSNFVFRETGET
jgi:UDP-N-acetylglucosamine:LPS N-acetylglucosamine transferase